MIKNYVYSGTDDRDLFRKIAKGKFEFVEEISSSAKKLIQTILKVNPQERLNTSQVN